MRVCSVDRLYHYLLSDAGAAPSIVARGLLPLSAMPESERWQAVEAALPGLFRSLYGLFAEPLLRRPYRNSGIFLTPIDFRRMPAAWPARAARLALPLSAVPLRDAALTYELDGQRHVLAVTAENLEHTARLWTEDLVRQWFGHDRTRMFFAVPQVAVYPEAGIAVRPEWLEPGS